MNCRAKTNKNKIAVYWVVKICEDTYFSRWQFGQVAFCTVSRDFAHPLSYKKAFETKEAIKKFHGMDAYNIRVMRRTIRPKKPKGFECSFTSDFKHSVAYKSAASYFTAAQAFAKAHLKKLTFEKTTQGFHEVDVFVRRLDGLPIDVSDTGKRNFVILHIIFGP